MTSYSAGDSIGARIKMARKARGFRSGAELAGAITRAGGNVTVDALENIEGGRKPDLHVSQLLNIAAALRVPVSALLAPVARPSDRLDLPNLSKAFDGMTAAEFDAWLCAVPAADYRATSADERNDRAQLAALRELEALKREHRRLLVAGALGDGPASSRLAQLDFIAAQVRDLTAFLHSAGWRLDDDMVAVEGADPGGAR